MAAFVVTTGPITGSRKIYRELPDGARVPCRRVELTNGEHLDLYDVTPMEHLGLPDRNDVKVGVKGFYLPLTP